MASLAVVVLDTLRKDYFDEYFDWLPGLRFESAYSTANWTGPAHASMFSGQYGSVVDVSSKSRVFDWDGPVLPELLADRGFRTRAWSANPNVSRATNFHRGFQEFTGPSELKTGNRDILDVTKFGTEHADLSRGRRYARAVFESFAGEYDTLASIRHGWRTIRGTEPSLIPDDGASVVRNRVADLDVAADEFLFVNLVEAHTPYFPPEPYRDFDEPIRMPFGEAYLGVADPELTVRGYKSAVRYLADVYRDIFEGLISEYDVVVTLSDHGELLGEHHDMWNHVTGIYPELTHIPLVVSGDGWHGETDELVSIIDLFPTILDALDMDAPDCEGRVVPSGGNRPTYLAEYRGPFQRSVDRSKEYDFDLKRFDRDLFALIEPGYYGYEDYDGWCEVGDRTRQEPRGDLHDIVDAHGMETLSRATTDLSDAAEARLAELGYI